ncbi:MAG: dTMP kinase [FCB group bacterium]|nr:dTMP kinase [FCB group bacterium]
MSISKSGKLITFEGIDGCGKSTQVELLRDKLLSHQLSVECVREPGGTKASEAIRKLLLHRRDLQLSARTEALLMCAARAQLTHTKILPWLKAGTWVISDRYSDSTLAYQGAGRGLDMDWLITLNQFATQSTEPDVTFFVDIDPIEGHRRLKTRPDKIEAEGIDFQKRVRQQYLELAVRFPGRFITLDGADTIENIHQNILTELTRRSFI